MTNLEKALNLKSEADQKYYDEIKPYCEFVLKWIKDKRVDNPYAGEFKFARIIFLMAFMVPVLVRIKLIVLENFFSHMDIK